MKSIISDLHKGGDFNELKQRFATMAEGVSHDEIADMEQELIREGIPETEIKKMCDVHVAMFKDSMDIFGKLDAPPGHPIATFVLENRAIQKVIDKVKADIQQVNPMDVPSKENPIWNKLANNINQLREIDKHYLRKEHQLFPYLEKKGFTGPSQVMWAIHDDIRSLLKTASSSLVSQDWMSLLITLPNVLTQIEDMFFKEEKILFPVALEKLTPEEWDTIKRNSAEIGFTLIGSTEESNPIIPISLRKSEVSGDRLSLDTGALTLEQVNLILKHLPIELSFVDENDEVRYYTELPNKIFPRTPEVIGRKVQNCHPPKSLHIVTEILNQFRAGKRDVAEFWIQIQGKYLHIRYFAVRDENNNYRGTLETVQDITSIRSLEGERRLLEWR